MEWLICVLFGFALFRMMTSRRHCSPGRLGGRSHRSLHRGHDSMGTANLWRPNRAGLAERRGQSVPPVRSESPMESLQRRFVQGGISVEQYEAELDRLFAKPANRMGGELRH